MILVMELKVLFFDEFIVGMVVGDILMIVELICSVVKDCIVVMVEYNLLVVESFCDKVIVLVCGEVMVEGIYSEICDNVVVC